jgi:hypothetical protein
MQVNFGGVYAASYTVVSPTEIQAVAPRGSGVVGIQVVTGAGATPFSNADRFAYVGPWVTRVAPTTASAAGGTPVTLTGFGFSGATAVSFGATPATAYTVVSGTEITATAPAVAAGSVDVHVTTPNGTSPTTASDRITYLTPSLTRVTPNSGAANKSNAVTLTGVELTGATAVDFGATPAPSFTVRSPTSIIAMTPPEPAGKLPVTVVTSLGATTATAADTYTFKPTTVTRISPNTGTVAGGTSVLVTGTLFTGTSSVTFSGTPAASYTMVSPTKIIAVSPPEPAGVVDIVVSDSAGTTAPVSADQFTYVVPAVGKVSPTTGSHLGGTTVTITGLQLRTASAVKFGTTTATSFTVVSATSITAVSPPGVAGTVDVRVTTTAGQTAATAADHFTYT